jgi:O-antigen/teichoic acid export membrane protein
MSLEEALIYEEGSILEASVIERETSRKAISRSDVNSAQAVMGPSPMSSVTESPVVDTVTASWIDRLVAALSGGSIFRKSVLALVDQGVVSAVNFLTIVLIRRSTSGTVGTAEHELGLYQLGFSIVMLTTCVQNALISMPYAVFGNRLHGAERKQYAGSTLVHQGLFSILITALFVAVGLVLAIGWAGASFSDVAFMLAAMTPFILVREFVRRIAFVHLQVVEVLLLDIVVAATQLAGLLALKSIGQLTATTTFCVAGLACGIAGLTALYLLRSHFDFRHSKSWPDLRLNWSFGKWAFAAQVVYLAIAYSPSWMLAILLGPAATGRFAVGLSLIMIANPLLIGLYNFLGPQAIYAYHADGLVALQRLTIRIAIIVTAAVSALYALLILFSGTLLVAVFGAKMQGQEEIVTILAVCIVVYAMSISAENGLTALNRPALILWANVAGLMVMLVAGYFLISATGIIGAAWTATIGSIVAAGFKIALFYRTGREIAERG